MDELEKLLRKAPTQDRERLVSALEKLHRGDLDGLKIKKLSGSPFHSVRIGDFRIIFLIGKQNEIQIESVRRRNEKTYK